MGYISVSGLAQPKRFPMLDLAPRREDLEPIELASRAEISALQLERLKRLDQLEVLVEAMPLCGASHLSC